MPTSTRNIKKTGATLPIVTTRGNEKPVTYFISYIRERVGSATRNWREIAQAFADAKEMYGADSVTFKELCTETKFTRSTADRLAKVATDKRLKEHSEHLATVHSWSTLYAITQLDDEQFARLIADHGNGFITENMVKAIRKGSSVKKDSWRVFATIYVDENAMKGQLFNEHAETLHELLSRVGTIPNVKIAESEAHEKIDNRFQALVFNERKRLIRKEFNSAIDAYAKYASPPPTAKGKPASDTARRKWVIKQLFGSAEDMWGEFEKDPKIAFGMMGSDRYDENSFNDLATANVTRRREKSAERLRFGEGQFAEANSALAKSEAKTPTFSGSAGSEVFKLKIEAPHQTEAPVTLAITKTNEPAPVAMAAD